MHSASDAAVGSKLNILMVTPFPPSREKGGIPNIILRLSQNLVQRGHEVTVLAPTPQTVCRTQGKLTILGAKSFRLPKWPYHSLMSFSVPYNFLALISLMTKLICKEEVDVLHAHGQKYLSTWAAIHLAFRAKLPSLLTVHGTYGLKYYSWFAGFLEEAINRTILKGVFERSSAITCSTQLELDYVKRYYEDAGWYQLFNGIDVMRFYNASKQKTENRERYQIPLNKKVILFAGRLTHVKGIGELMKAVRSVTDAFPDAYFLIVGDGPLLKDVEKTVRNEQGRMKAIKWVPYYEMHRIFALSDLYVLPSRSEGLPLTIIEAMASGLHIVTTSVGGIPEILVGYGHKTYIEEVSASAISDGILKGLNVAPTGRAGNSGNLQYVKKFDLSSITDELERIYVEITG